ncbi:response regulator [Nocardioides bruguierae]|uniref:Response regulator n=2 Tax=Nocardioides bruguierae TaxID=2945102 RepID=A0A9X2D8S0_9ACTN|nr:response regulator [Nocardioides bruguierae]MCM0621402.1 response regulator [Nocardioides bruguierae]
MGQLPAVHADEGGMKNVLLVEDDGDIAVLLGFALRGSGVRLEVVATVDAALDVLARRETDLLVTDVRLGTRETGLDLVLHARALGLEPLDGVVVISASVMAEDLAAAQDAGVTEFVAKPFDVRALARRVAAVTGSPQAA